MPEPTLLILENDPAALHQLADKMRTQANYRVLTELFPENVLERLESEAVDLLLCDLSLPEMEGLDLLTQVRERFQHLPVLVYSQREQTDDRILAMQHGATAYLTPPLDARLLTTAVESALKELRLTTEVEKLKRRLGGDHKLGGLVGRSQAMHRVFDVIREVCEVDSTVLIKGETGTGKELVARALHFEGPRASKPFVKVNCAALPETLLESELFGHEKGAYTDARQSRMGKFELAHGGTVFLDEIGDLSFSTQVKLLNVLQDREIERLGSNKRVPVNIRVITATNRDLEKLVQNGHFRLDLYYRLNVVPITVTALRERREEDIPLLCAHFLDKIGSRLGKGSYTLTDDAMAVLLSHNWPGNVRELENVIERAILATLGTVIKADVLSYLSRDAFPMMESLPYPVITDRPAFPAPFAQPRSDSGELITPGPLKQAVKSFEKMFIETTLAASGGHVIRAARMLKIDRTTLWKKARDLGINMHNDNDA